MIHRFQIDVTEDHIRRGVQCGGSSCPLALAFNDVIPESIAPQGVRVGCYEVTAWKSADPAERNLWSVQLPTVAVEFQRNFDLGYTDLIHPISFPLEIEIDE